MKKYLFLFMITFVLCLSGCNSKKQYTVKLDNDGTIEEMTVSEGDEVKLPVLEKEYYSFDGWKYNDKIVKSLTMPNHDITLKAVFTITDNLELVKKELSVPTTINSNIELIKEMHGCTITWKSSNQRLMNNSGEINRQTYDAKVTLTASIKYNSKIVTKKFTVTIEKITASTILSSVMNDVKPLEIENDRVLLNNNFIYDFEEITSSWESSNTDLILNDGTIINYPDKNETVTFKLTLIFDGEILQKDFTITLNPLTTDEMFDKAFSLFNYSFVTNNLVLPKKTIFDIECKWISGNEAILTNDGKISSTYSFSKTTLKLIMTKKSKTGEIIMEKSKTMNITISVQDNLVLIDNNNFQEGTTKNLTTRNNLLVLEDDKVLGEYLSKEITTKEFTSLVASFSGFTTENSTIELQVRVYNNEWSKFFTYTKDGYGLGKKNYSNSDKDNVAKLGIDELSINSGTATKLQFKLILKRPSVNYETPGLRIVTAALNLVDKQTTTSEVTLPTYVKHEVLKLNQNIVPGIGSVICSATSSTMLLSYKGLDFSSFDDFPHRYVAGLVLDSKENIYGNWSFNTITMGAFGFRSYVKRIDSINNLLYQLSYGPVALSVGGEMISDQKTYKTAGHLICAIGYEYIDDELFIICNDPNVENVECRYSEKVIEKTWKNITYVVE